MIAPRYDIHTAPVLDWVATLTLQDSAGAALNLTGGTLAADIALTPGSAVLGSFTADLVTPAAGIARLTLSHTTATALGLGTFYYDVIYTTSTGLRALLLTGRLFVKPTVTSP